MPAHEGINPDSFTLADIQRIAKKGALKMASGVPIRSVVLLRSITDPVIIPRKRVDPDTGAMVPDMDPHSPESPHPRTKRVYIGGNNHHVEIRQKERRRKGETKIEYVGNVVTTFEAAKRNAARLLALRNAGALRLRKLAGSLRIGGRRLGGWSQR